MTLVQIGTLGRPHGVAGEVYLDRCSLTADELAAIGAFAWRGRDGATRELALASARPADRRLIVGFRVVANQVSNSYSEQLGKLDDQVHRRVRRSALLQIEHMRFGDAHLIGDLLKRITLGNAKIM